MHRVLAALTLTTSIFLLARTVETRGEAYRNPYGRLPGGGTVGDRMFAETFRREVRALADRPMAGSRHLGEWKEAKERRRREWLGMLGLDPEPARTELGAVVTGTNVQADFRVEKLHFQSMPQLYVTANLYLPVRVEAPVPAVLYVCGHAQVKSNGISYGNKVAYQRHGIWLARHGYACLVIDTLQLGEIEGLHHGTSREGMWWWNSRGYTPAGIEAWNAIRALDYLESRPEVDRMRLGMTGRSGGGAYTWTVAALDERVRVACPVAGMTDLENQVVDGVVEGHCDCMFHVNTRRWDFAEIAALIAPRPLLILNTDKDTIFPMDGVLRVHERVRRIYDLYGAGDSLGLAMVEGPHKDVQELQVPVFRWFNRFLKGIEVPIEAAALPRFSGEELRVFRTLPADERNTSCHEWFPRTASEALPVEASRAISELRWKTFGGWPAGLPEASLREVNAREMDGVRYAIHELESQPGMILRVHWLRRAGVEREDGIRLVAVDEVQWGEWLASMRGRFGELLADELAVASGVSVGALAGRHPGGHGRWWDSVKSGAESVVLVVPRGVGLTALSPEARYQVHVRRRLMLLGQTLAGMQVFDVLRASGAVRAVAGAAPIRWEATPGMVEVMAFGSLFQDGLEGLELPGPIRGDKEAPDFLNGSTVVTPGQLMSLCRGRCRVSLAGQ